MPPFDLFWAKYGSNVKLAENSNPEFFHVPLISPMRIVGHSVSHRSFRKSPPCYENANPNIVFDLGLAIS